MHKPRRPLVLVVGVGRDAMAIKVAVSVASNTDYCRDALAERKEESGHASDAQKG